MSKIRMGILMLALPVLMSCRVAKPTSEVPLESKTEVRDRLVDVPAVQDSATLQAYFECDSNNRVILKEYNQLMSDYVSLKSLMTPTDAGLLFTVDLNTNHPGTTAKVSDSIVTREVPVYVKGDNIEVIKPIKPWQKLLIYSGALLWLVILFYIGFEIKKLLKP